MPTTLGCYSKQRSYFHGDVTEDGACWYDKRCDAFRPLPAREPTLVDLMRLRLELRALRWLRKRERGFFRPDDARNVFAQDERFLLPLERLRRLRQEEFVRGIPAAWPTLEGRTGELLREGLR